MNETYEVDIVQYMLPNGHRIAQKTNLPIGTEKLYDDMLQHNCRFTGEILSTDLVSLTISNGEDDDEEDVDIEIVENGPTVQEAMVNMLERQKWLKNESAE